MREFWMYASERDERTASREHAKVIKATGRTLDTLLGDWLEASQDTGTVAKDKD